MPVSEASPLRSLLDTGAGDDAEYGGSLSNHLPMALVALHRLGAEPARLEAFAAQYRRRLQAAPPVEPWPAGEPWPDALGDPRAWPAYRSLFNDWLDHEGAPLVLAQALPTLMRGVGAAAFHGLIRTAYAVTAGHLHELADALAYWACRWFHVGEADATAAAVGREREPAVVLAALDTSGTLPGDLIAERMAAVAATSTFERAAARLLVDREDTLPRLARLAAQRYADSRNFTVLHLVTGAHAMRLLLPWLDEDDALPALRHYARAFVAGYAASGLAHKAGGDTGAVPPWTEIVAKAVASDDDHVVKLVDSCREQERAYGGAAWRRAAARAVAGR